MRRDIPAVNRFLQHPVIAPYEDIVGRDVVRRAVDAIVERARAARRVPPFERLVAEVADRIEREGAQRLLPVVNATGILLHTNLGRAPLAAHALAASATVGEGYSNLEYDLVAGERGTRYARVTPLLCELTGAQDALVVNNCAAAVLLILDTFARGSDAIVARSQLIEIGGGFRLPDVLERSGARLVEVGTTNKTYVADYERALSPRTGLLLRSHPSNYFIQGFVHEVTGEELSALGKRAGVMVAEDLGSGALIDLTEYGLPRERTVGDAVRDGIDLIAFSGDKLLGGPQAGIVVGSAPAIARLRSNPLLRALRSDKIALAQLAATLRLHRTRESREHIPLYRMLAASLDELRARGEKLLRALDGAHLVETVAYVGGGCVPQAGIPSIALAFPTSFASELAQRLRSNRMPIVARVDDDAVVLDLRTIAPAQDETVVLALRALTA